MSDNTGPLPRPKHPLDALVFAHLAASGADVDGAAMLGPALARRERGRDGWRRLAVGLPAALAAGLLLALLLARPPGRMQASPAQVVERAREAHEAPVDRCYRLRTELTGPLKERFAQLHLDRDVTLWTRGDRFRVEPALAGRGTWGRDEHGRVWVAPTRTAGAVFRPGEVPRVLDEALALRSVDLTRLLDVVLRDCDLTRLPWRPGAPLDTVRIEALPRATASPGLQHAVLDVDPKDDTVRHLSLRRRVPGGALTLTLDLQGAQTLPEGSYTLQGHLGPGARVYDKARPAARAAFLLKHGLHAVREKRP